MTTGFMSYVFDLDGTLMDTSSFVPDAYIACVASVGGPRYDRLQIIDAYGLGPPEKILTHLLRRDCSARELDTYHRFLEAYSSAARPYEGIVGTLELLSDRHPLAIFSGASRLACGLLLRATALEQFFAVIVGGDEVARPKPHPEGLLLACRRLGIPPNQTAYVGDSNLDMQAARAAGCYAIAAGWGHLDAAKGSSPDRVVKHPGELLTDTPVP